ncbi:EamA/RhaT family transporter [Streptomyces sp. NPDC127068]|uniref:EamA/RhaT family transporter n=1 Tax=Streptomyces sp. NPDC127068 TaxID=3347127 RepID=UPI0036570387
MSEPPTPPAGPQPAPLRFFGTAWLHHDQHYAARRITATTASLAATAAGALVLRFAYEGMAAARVGPFVNVAVVLMFTVCSALAFRRTWDGFTQAPPRAVDPSAGRGVRTIGFLGGLLAYFLRSLTEAPGEKRLRAEYETQRAQYARRTARRAGHPAKRRRT